MFYKGILQGHNTVFVAESIAKLANKMNVVVSTVSRGLNGLPSPHYKFSIISEEEYLRIVNEKKAARVVSSTTKKNDPNVFIFANILKIKKLKQFKEIQEFYKNDAKKMQSELAKARVILNTQKFHNYTFEWCRLNNNYKRI